MANAAEAMMWAAVFAPIADEIAESIVRKEELRRSEEELRRSEEKLAEGNRDYKRKTIGWLRDGTTDGLLRRLRAIDPERPPIYPHISAEKEADMLESGELKLGLLYAPMKNGKFIDNTKDSQKLLSELIWADETREEAQHPWYIERRKDTEELIAEGWSFYIV